MWNLITFSENIELFNLYLHLHTHDCGSICWNIIFLFLTADFEYNCYSFRVPRYWNWYAKFIFHFQRVSVERNWNKIISFICWDSVSWRYKWKLNINKYFLPINRLNFTIQNKYTCHKQINRKKNTQLYHIQWKQRIFS